LTLSVDFSQMLSERVTVASFASYL